MWSWFAKNTTTDPCVHCFREAAYLYRMHVRSCNYTLLCTPTNLRMRMYDATWFLGMRTCTGSHVVSGHAYTDAQPRGFLVGLEL